jgi:peptide-methionine (S)-S-oxide reductase
MATELAVFGGGCFWCTEAVFKRIRGVGSVLPGYAGGSVEKPSYQQVSSGTSGHAEVVRVEYDPSLISYDDLLTVFFASHDPTTPDRQGDDVGTQYRSVIYTTSDRQQDAAEQFIERLNAATAEGAPVVTEVRPLVAFFRAEQEHLDYYTKNRTAPYCQLVINPKLRKLQERFSSLLKPGESNP